MNVKLNLLAGNVFFRVVFVLIQLIFVSCSSVSSSNNGSQAKRPTVFTVRKTSYFQYSNLNYTPLQLYSRHNLLPAYIEKIQLYKRTLERQRYKTAIYGGEKALIARFHLAVLLWRMSTNLLGALPPKPAADAAPDAILKYRKAKKKIRDFRMEALFHLDYLVDRNFNSRKILERYAYYSSRINPAKSISLFYKLFAKTKGKKQEKYINDFGSLLLHQQRCSEAETILGKKVSPGSRERNLFLRALTWFCKPAKFQKEDNKFWLKSCNQTGKKKIGEFLPLLAKAAILKKLISGDNLLDLLASKCKHFASRINKKRFGYIYDEYLAKWKLGSLEISKFNIRINHLGSSKWKEMLRKYQKQLQPFLKFIYKLVSVKTRLELNFWMKSSRKITPVFNKGSHLYKILNSLHVDYGRARSPGLRISFIAKPTS
ncbi:MAG: hypothetical protein PF689_01720 [Deltaproteobacteria bacterium]|jgi:hypothetical protein|nr:hypothetical protein [Deltaproteobacteria bacterium]